MAQTGAQGIRPLVYISAPFGADEEEQRSVNVRRALALARVAVAEGFSPVVVHALLEREDCPYGEDSDPSAREVGLHCDESLVHHIALTTMGGLWEVLTLEGERSSGMRREWSAWRRVRGCSRVGIRSRTWAQWRPVFEKHGLDHVWWSLRNDAMRPTFPPGGALASMARGGRL